MTRSDAVVEAVKQAPVGPTVMGLSLWGIPLQEWVYILTIGFTLMQVYFLLRDKWWRQRK